MYNFLIFLYKLKISTVQWRETEKARKGILNDSNVSLDVFFTKRLESPECLHFLMNSMKNIVFKINDIYEMNQVTQDNQVKGHNTSSQTFPNQQKFVIKHWTNWKDKTEKKTKKINNLEEKTGNMDKKMMI